MNLNLVNHFLKKNRDIVLKKSIINCHVEGVDSILFDDTPESRVRMFVANANHKLWTNDFFGSEPMSAAFHAHHCDLVLEAVRGYSFVNSTVSTCHPPTSFSKMFRGFDYESKIIREECRFIAKGDFRLSFLSHQEVSTSISLKSTDIHTVFVPRGVVSAWMVYEGKENPDYDSTCYSNVDLSKFDASRLYQPMSEEYLHKLISRVFD